MAGPRLAGSNAPTTAEAGKLGPLHPIGAKRGPTSRDLLRIEWEYPVLTTGVTYDEEGTTAHQARRALPLEEALAVLAKDDRRPMLVLRECLACSGTEDALLSRKDDNERTLLLSQWFHCVKLPVDVLEEDHPFRNVFPGDDPPHLFVSRWDGQRQVALQGDQSRRELWGVMESLLSAEYEGKAEARVKDLLRLLDRCDLLDERSSKLQDRVDDLVESKGPGSKKLAKLLEELRDLKEERKELLSRFAQAAQLKLRPLDEDSGTSR